MSSNGVCLAVMGKARSRTRVDATDGRLSDRRNARTEEIKLDINVTEVADSEWVMKDLLGRPLGRIVELENGQFVIEPGPALPIPSDRTHPTLDGALRSIEQQTKNVCRYDG